MIYNSPFFPFSYYRKKPINKNNYIYQNSPYNYYGNYYNSSTSINSEKNNALFKHSTSNNPLNHTVNNSNTVLSNSEIYLNNEKTNRIDKKNNGTEVFEIFGLKLYFDDILLICLIFFLYNEGVKDQYLFISLILLLLS